MALPIILVDSATGSDSAASGAGPSIAITGSAGVSSGTTVTLDGSPDLSGVATDGSAVIYFADTTAGNRNFSKITAVDNGAKTVTVAVAFTAGTKAWAIGGKRASIGSATSKKLFDNNGSAGDIAPGWVVEMQSGHTETIAATYDFRRAGSNTVGHIELRGAPGGTRPIITFSNNGAAFVIRAEFMQFKFFEMRNSNATKNASVGISFGSLGQYESYFKVEDVKICHSTDKFWRGIYCGPFTIQVELCEIGYTASYGIANVANDYCRGIHIRHNKVHHCGANGIHFDVAFYYNSSVYGNWSYANTGHGIFYDDTRPDGTCGINIAHNTLDANTGDGIRINSAAECTVNLYIQNNILSNNGGYGIKFQSGTFTAVYVLAMMPYMRGNCTYNNTSGACNLSGVLFNDAGTDPTFAGASSQDFTIGTNLKGKGFPVAGTHTIGGTAGTSSYVDPGAAQRQEQGTSPVGQSIAPRAPSVY